MMPRPALKTTDPDPARIIVRLATETDLDALTAFEDTVFSGDRISRRSFRYLLARQTAETIIAEVDGILAGYAMILFRTGTSLARLYSIAVGDMLRSSGVGSELMKAVEQSAFDHDRMWLRLEVRADNDKAISFYRNRGYRQIGSYADYYDDHCDALRFEKAIKGLQPPVSHIPYYEQSEDFTCGAACLLMAFAAFGLKPAMTPVEEIMLWREATTVFMQSGPGGCEPYGLAVTATARGLDAGIVCSQEGPLFLESVRSTEKRRVMRLAQEGFRQRAEELSIPAKVGDFTIDELRSELAGGALAIVLISGYRMFDKKVPHWILAHGDDGRHILVHDPWVEEEREESLTDSMNLPIPYEAFDRMARFGKNRLRAIVYLKAK